MPGKLNGPKQLTEGLVYSDIQDKISALEDNKEFEVESADEAVAIALALCDPGQCVTLHDEECACNDQGEGCTCIPTTLVAGAQA